MGPPRQFFIGLTRVSVKSIFMNPENLYFILAFAAAMLWCRVLFSVVPIYFKRPLTRSVLKLSWHHLHYGILLTLAGVILLLYFHKNTIVTILLGIGLGLMMDLFIPSLLLETNREEELVVYKKSLVPTIFLFVGVIGLILILPFLF